MLPLEWRNGRRCGLKIRWAKSPYGFESHLQHVPSPVTRSVAMPRVGLALVVLALSGLPLRAAVAPPPSQWIAVVAPDFADAIGPLARARRSQGLRVVVVKTTDV